MIEKNELRKKYELKRESTKIDMPYSNDSSEQITIALKQLCEDSLNGKNTYATIYAHINSGLCSYNIYSCDLEGKTPEQLFSAIYSRHKNIEACDQDKLHIHNGAIIGNVSNLLQEKMAETFYSEGFSDDIFIYNSRDGISAIFDQYFADTRSPDEFKDEASLIMFGKTLDEFKKSIGIDTTKTIIPSEAVKNAIKESTTTKIQEANNMEVLNAEEKEIDD